MKKRWIIVLSVVGFLLLAGTVGAYFAMDYGVKRALDLLAEDAPLTAESGTDSEIDSDSESAPGSQPTLPADSSPADDEEPPPVDDETDKPKPTNEIADDRSPANSSDASHGEEKEPAATETKTDTVTQTEPETKQENSSTSHRYNANISVERAKEVEKDISLSEKTKVTTVLLKSFSASDIRLLTELAGGGLTIEEKREAKKLFLERLSAEEYDELIEIAANYGLSQGKSYDESVKSLEK